MDITEVLETSKTVIFMIFIIDILFLFGNSTHKKISSAIASVPLVIFISVRNFYQFHKIFIILANKYITVTKKSLI